METIIGLSMGIGLSAASGFRVFVPLLIMSLGMHLGYISPHESFRWVGSTPALVVLSVATAVEFLGYLIPMVDHALDAMALPASAVAGTVLTAGAIAELDPFARYTLAIIAGGGTAAAMRSSLALGRGASTATTGGLANPVLSVFEFFASIFVTIFAVLLPVFAVVCLFFVMLIILRWAYRRATRSRYEASIRFEEE
ncbi:DUF4126 domain-containing protein [Singulisphaera sp. PoT]|uniref:DUF4126 domain-containing protein n=1 Tax=Singulisphaera sp. PoT TaxID=3411797 RepID=UPI003BF5B97B